MTISDLGMIEKYQEVLMAAISNDVQDLRVQIWKTLKWVNVNKNRLEVKAWKVKMIIEKSKYHSRNSVSASTKWRLQKLTLDLEENEAMRKFEVDEIDGSQCIEIDVVDVQGHVEGQKTRIVS